MPISSEQARNSARAFANHKKQAWDETDAVLSSREINGIVYWAVTTTEAYPSSTPKWAIPLGPSYVSYLIDRDTGECVGIANHRMTHWLPKPWQIGDDD